MNALACVTQAKRKRFFTHPLATTAFVHPKVIAFVVTAIGEGGGLSDLVNSTPSATHGNAATTAALHRKRYANAFVEVFVDCKFPCFV